MCLTWGSQYDGVRLGLSELTTATGNLLRDPSPEPFMLVLLKYVVVRRTAYYRCRLQGEHVREARGGSGTCVSVEADAEAEVLSPSLEILA